MSTGFLSAKNGSEDNVIKMSVNRRFKCTYVLINKSKYEPDYLFNNVFKMFGMYEIYGIFGIFDILVRHLADFT